MKEKETARSIEFVTYAARAHIQRERGSGSETTSANKRSHSDLTRNLNCSDYLNFYIFRVLLTQFFFCWCDRVRSKQIKTRIFKGSFCLITWSTQNNMGIIFYRYLGRFCVQNCEQFGPKTLFLFVAWKRFLEFIFRNQGRLLSNAYPLQWRPSWHQFSWNGF